MSDDFDVNAKSPAVKRVFEYVRDRIFFAMKGFCEAYADSPKLAPLVREIGWPHNIVIMERCQDPLEREYYIRMTRKFG